MPEGANQKLIITHAVLTGLTPLIPIPILDDLVKSYFQRRLARGLALAHSITLTEAEVRTIADDPGGGCLKGCLGGAILLPFKLIFRKIFLFLEWKRAVDTASRTYHQGYLLDCALQERWLEHRGPVDLRAAVDSVLRETGTAPVERAISLTFNQSKSTLRSAANLLKRSLQNITGKPDESRVALAAEAVEAEEERQIEGVIARLQKAIQNVPSDYFENLRSRMRARLGA